MSRHWGKHLERDGAVAEQVQAALGSAGPCPGPCNAAYRRLRARWEREVLEQFDRSRALLAGEVDELELLRTAQVLVRDRWEDEGLAAWPAREGRPVWCLACQSRVRGALDRLPRMLLLTLETGWSTPTRPDGSPVTAPVLVLSTSDPDEDGRVVEVLSCGHRHTRPALPGPVREPGTVTRRCRTCIASSIVPEPGRLAPPERAGRRGHRQPVSPAGSPAWVEADAAVEWVCSAADRARWLLGASRRMVIDELPPSRWPWRSPSTQARLAAATHDAQFLLAWLEPVLALPVEVSGSIGAEAVRISDRLQLVCGMAIGEHAVEGECPRCDRRGLARENGGSFVHCRSCGGWWNEDQFEAEQARRADERSVS